MNQDKGQGCPVIGPYGDGPNVIIVKNERSNNVAWFPPTCLATACYTGIREDVGAMDWEPAAGWLWSMPNFESLLKQFLKRNTGWTS
jgi:hypothetical protein